MERTPEKNEVRMNLTSRIKGAKTPIIDKEKWTSKRKGEYKVAYENSSITKEQKDKRVVCIDAKRKMVLEYFPVIKKRSSIVLNSRKPFPEGFSITEMKNKKILISGGEQNNKIVSKAYYINEHKKMLMEIHSMMYARRDHGFVSIKGFAVAIGGYITELDMIKKCEKYDDRNDLWTELPELEEERNLLSPCAFSDIYIYVFCVTNSSTEQKSY